MQIGLQFSRVFWLGIGCQKGISAELINKAIEKIFQQYQISEIEITGIASLDTKASEIGLVEFCCLHNYPLKTFSAETLANVLVPNPEKHIQKLVGTPSVAEAAAILAASEVSSIKVKLLVPKQIFRLPGEVGSVTIAIAEGVNDNS